MRRKTLKFADERHISSVLFGYHNFPCKTHEYIIYVTVNFDKVKIYRDADRITPADEELIPHGQFRDVAGNLFDFRTPKPFIGDLSADPVLGKRGCYDENFVLNGSGMRRIATLEGGNRGIKLEVFSDQPGMQIYTGNPHAIALETQNFPNAVNEPSFPSIVLPAEEMYYQKIVFKLGTF